MALERESIEKKDFPIGAHGYDPEAVDAHLSALAEQIDALKRSARRRSETVASTAGDQVRAIVEAAEKSAAEIERQAEQDALQTRAETAAEAQSIRERATAQAREYVGKVSAATDAMLQRVEAMESELDALSESLRTGARRLTADLKQLQTEISDARAAAVAPPRFEPEVPAGASAAASAAAADVQPIRDADFSEQRAAHQTTIETTIETYAGPLPEAVPAVEDAAATEASAMPASPAAAATTPSEPPVERELVREAEPSSEEKALSADRAQPGTGSDDTEGARLIALNMALNGTPREETDRYLAANFALSDRGRLLDEVYASVEG